MCRDVSTAHRNASKTSALQNVPLRRTAASARCGSAATRDRLIASLLAFVHLSSQRTLEPVRQDGCFAEKQEPHPALLLIVPSERLGGTAADARIRGTTSAGFRKAIRLWHGAPVADRAHGRCHFSCAGRASSPAPDTRLRAVARERCVERAYDACWPHRSGAAAAVGRAVWWSWMRPASGGAADGLHGRVVEVEQVDLSAQAHPLLVRCLQACDRRGRDRARLQGAAVGVGQSRLDQRCE
jgi:hypothetical protein